MHYYKLIQYFYERRKTKNQSRVIISFVHFIYGFCEPRWKVFGQVFFKKLAGSRGAEPPKKRRFSFCKAFSFAPLVSKEKAKVWDLMLLSISAQCSHSYILPVILSGAKRSRTFLSQIPNVTAFRLLLTAFGVRLRSGWHGQKSAERSKAGSTNN